MRLGMMNNPRLDVCQETRWAAAHGFEFLDLTIEGPCADLEHIDFRLLRSILQDTGLGIVGHTAPYLFFASPVPGLRRAAVEHVARAFEPLASLGVRWVNVHLLAAPRMFGRDDFVRWSTDCLVQLAEQSAAYGLKIMAEHPPDPSVLLADMRKILDTDDRLGFHLDIGHAHVAGIDLDDLLRSVGLRLAHVHMSDNRGRLDDHLPMGAGRIDWPTTIRCLKSFGYDDAITLEVFTPDLDYLLLSAAKVRGWWQGNG